MDKEQILQVVHDECKTLGWDPKEALSFLQTIGFTPERVAGNPLFGEHKVRTTVQLGYLAFQESKAKS